MFEVIKKTIFLEYTNARYNTYEQYNVLYTDSVPVSLTHHVYQNESLLTGSNNVAIAERLSVANFDE